MLRTTLLLALFSASAFAQQDVVEQPPVNIEVAVELPDIAPLIGQVELLAGNTAPDLERLERQEQREERSVALQEQDLDYQLGMARWTFWLFFMSIASTLLSGAGIGLLYKNLIEARRATSATETTANAAYMQASQTRPYLIIDFHYIGSENSIMVRTYNEGELSATRVTCNIESISGGTFESRSVTQARETVIKSTENNRKDFFFRYSTDNSEFTLTLTYHQAGGSIEYKDNFICTMNGTSFKILETIREAEFIRPRNDG